MGARASSVGASAGLFALLTFAGIRRRGLALLSAGVLVLIAIACFFGPMISHSATSTAFSPLLPPNATNPMGTDALGRDLLVRVLEGGQISLIAGFSVALLCLS